MMNRLILLGFLLTVFELLENKIQAQKLDFHQLTHRMELDVRPGFVAQDNPFFKGKNQAGKPIRHALSTHLKYSFQFRKDSEIGRLYPHAYQGIGLSYHYLDNHLELGSPVSIYAFQGSRIARLYQVLSFDYEWNFGVSFGWKKHDAFTNTYNGAVGSKINAYINLGFLLNWQLAPQWNLKAGIDLTHFSNGNTHYPNSGVNLIGAKIGVVHTFGSSENKDTKPTTQLPDCKIFKPHFSYDLILYGATRKRAMLNESNPYMIPGSFGLVGLNFNPMYNFNRYFRAGVSLDAQYDESANVENHYAGGGPNDPKFYKPPFREQFSVGFSARGELVMPIFSLT
ncbi:hypothetical protein EVA_06205 [gut metagenome]|uniref:Acyloxyacyl hydrolase n=1 Tax=gut metagenome TaxID=749906 RepID=J9GY19_9ZZZZ